MRNEETSRRQNVASAIKRRQNIEREKTEQMFVMKNHEVLEHVNKRSTAANVIYVQ